jgi:hypothetical protein
MRTQNPPPLKACRFDSDLGHHLCEISFPRRLPLSPVFASMAHS